MFGGARKHLPDSYERGTYRRVLQVDGKSVLVSISSPGTTLKPRLRVEVFPYLSKSKSLLLRAVLNRMVEASFDYDGFRRLARKDRVMRGVCSTIAGIRELALEELRKLTDEAAMAELMIRGVGRWSAEYALLRGLGRVNSLPADDLGVQRAVSISYFHGRKVSSDQVRRVLRKFAPYSGIAAFFLMYNLFWKPQEAHASPPSSGC
jgi:integrase